jgi:hypothetical protein
MFEPLKAGFGQAANEIGKAANAVGKLAQDASEQVVEQTGDLKDAAEHAIEKLTAMKLDPYDDAIAEYNGAYTAMNDSGLSLLRQRERCTDLLDLVEFLVNSIANTPKSFQKDFQEIDVHKEHFTEVVEFARRDLEAARASAAAAGAGFAAGAAVASIAPTAAMWAATTFGVASTGTAISTLSGAVATNAALAWLGGGALAAGGGGAAAGSALLALAGPIGWTLAGATLLVSIALFTRSKLKNREAKQAALADVKQNTAFVRGVDAEIDSVLQRTVALRERLLERYREAMAFYSSDFLALSSAERSQLAALVNNAKATAALLSHLVDVEAVDA